MKNDPRGIIDREPMSPLQKLVVGICIFLNALDGFDVLAITFSAPGIASDWDLSPADIGIVISTGLAGMALGSVFLAPYADKFGRRIIVLICLVVMGGGMLLSATADDLFTLSIYRVITGLGIGTMLASINAIAAEFSNTQRRSFSVSLMSAGYPVGGVIGGSIAALLLQHYDWQAVFIFGGVITLAILPVVYFVLPESIQFLCSKKGDSDETLAKVNKILTRMGHGEAKHIVTPDTPHKPSSTMDLFKPEIVKKTLTLTISYFLHIMTFYYVLGWVPSIVTALGFDKAVGTTVSVWVNLGGIIGGSILGFSSAYFGLRKMVLVLMLATGGFVIIFGHITPDLQSLKIIGFFLGVCMFSGVIGLYALMAQSFPTRLLATGTGFVIGIGRAGAAIGPLITGYLLTEGMGRGNVGIIMSLGSILAAVALMNSYLSKKKSSSIAD